MYFKAIQRKIIDGPPFLELVPLSQMFPLSKSILPTSPFHGVFGYRLHPPFRKGGGGHTMNPKRFAHLKSQVMAT